MEYFPAEITIPEPPVAELLWSPNELVVKLKEEGHFYVGISRDGPLYFVNDRSMRGVLPAGNHRFTLPHLPFNFLEKYPLAKLPTTLYENGHIVEFWRFRDLTQL